MLKRQSLESAIASESANTGPAGKASGPDAKLSDIGLSYGGADHLLNRTFEPGRIGHDADVAGLTEITVAPTTRSRAATYEFRTADDAAALEDVSPGLEGELAAGSRSRRCPFRLSWRVAMRGRLPRCAGVAAWCVLGLLSLMLQALPAAAAPPGPPDIVGVEPQVGYPYYIHNPRELDVEWLGPSDDGGSPITRWKIEWKSGTQDYSPHRRRVVRNTPRLQADTPAGPGYDFLIWYLAPGTEYTVRVTAVNADGEGPPSPERSGTTAVSKNAEVRRIVDMVVERNEGRSPWIRRTLDHLDRHGIPIVWGGQSVGSNGDVVLTCNERFSNGECKVNGVSRVRFYGVSVSEVTATHELAHVYTLSSHLAATPGPLAIALLYFSGLDLRPAHETRSCGAIELFADVVTMHTLGEHVWTSYWDACRGARKNTREALGVVRSALAGELPAWFSGRYGAAGGGFDLTSLWRDIWSTMNHTDFNLAINQLRNQFGGYCDWEQATRARIAEQSLGGMADARVRSRWGLPSA